MNIQCGSGFSSKRAPEEAAKEALEKAFQTAGTTSCDIVILFSAVGYDQERLIRGIRNGTQDSMLVGCSGEGVISYDSVNETPFALSLMILKSDALTFSVESISDVKKNCTEAGKLLGEAVHSRLREDTMSIWLFPDHLSMNYDAFLDSFETGLAPGRHIPIFGGGAADNWQFKKTYQFCNDEVLSDSVVCMVMSGPLSVTSDISHGCIPIGLEREVTKSEGNILYEIDNRKVTDVLQEYIPEEDVANWHNLGIRCLCLGLKAPDSLKKVYDDFIVRAMPVVDFETGSGRVSTELKPGTKVYMISRNPEKLIPYSRKMAENISERLHGNKPVFVLQIDCAGRSKVLRTAEKNEIQENLHTIAPSEVPWIGMYCYGEMGPVADKNYFHNFTVILAAFYQTE